jgi:hypothetical protein
MGQSQTVPRRKQVGPGPGHRPWAAVAPRRHQRDRGGLREAIPAASSTLSVSIANPIGHHASFLYRPVNSAATTGFQTKRPATWLDLGCFHHNDGAGRLPRYSETRLLRAPGGLCHSGRRSYPVFKDVRSFQTHSIRASKFSVQDCRTLDVPIDVATNPNRHPRAKGPWHDEKE